MSYTLPEFFAHAIALEKEAADRYLELADMMEAHRNDAVAKLFRDMVVFSNLHHDSIVQRAGKMQLPKLRSWEYRWTSPPEAGGEEAFDYMLEPYNALRYARANEVRAMEYYSSVGLHTRSGGWRRNSRAKNPSMSTRWMIGLPARPGPRPPGPTTHIATPGPRCHRRFISLFAESANVFGDGDGTDALAILRVANTEDASLPAFAYQVIAPRDRVLLDEYLLAPFFDCGADRDPLAIGGALHEARMMLEQWRADDPGCGLQHMPRRNAAGHEEMQRRSIHPSVIPRKKHDAGRIAVAETDFDIHRRGF
jgi:rubrerythrin